VRYSKRARRVTLGDGDEEPSAPQSTSAFAPPCGRVFSSVAPSPPPRISTFQLFHSASHDVSPPPPPTSSFRTGGGAGRRRNRGRSCSTPPRHASASSGAGVSPSTRHRRRRRACGRPRGAWSPAAVLSTLGKSKKRRWRWRQSSLPLVALCDWAERRRRPTSRCPVTPRVAPVGDVPALDLDGSGGGGESGVALVGAAFEGQARLIEIGKL